jgi:hypothetical protein
MRSDHLSKHMKRHANLTDVNGSAIASKSSKKLTTTNKSIETSQMMQFGDDYSAATSPNIRL